ncbi:Uncharacterized protein TCM_032366 isoform 4 [Theobroma cacao]|uniref:CASP-like protein n=1 Tax=Theobroma cacao TaxID=3641 RepID=A0A061FH10_THECC|nr:Uncharacterized protein TCM_032366 isoform 4 [Theobroma cacao]
MEKGTEKGNGVGGGAAASRSPMALMGSSRYENEEANTGMRTTETMLRLVPMALCIAALVVMLKNSQSNEFGSVSYSDLGAFRSDMTLQVSGACKWHMCRLFPSFSYHCSHASSFHNASSLDTLPPRSDSNIHNFGCRCCVNGGALPDKQRRCSCHLECSLWDICQFLS